MNGINTYWIEQANELKDSTAHLGEGFLLTASLDAIKKVAHEGFKSLDPVTQRAVIAQATVRHSMKAIVKEKTFYAENNLGTESPSIQALNKFVSENDIEIINIETLPSVDRTLALRLWYRQD